ncbi:MAG: class I SAM-dependent methyltransferase [Truepera sp.]|nr:class I SAM-dependent methyltransferase [Truepera sp.]
MPSEPFTDLASVYDAIMSDIEYDDWIAFILRTVIERGWKGGRILDLGCGTGNSTSPIFSRGFEVQGVDASAAMLAVAQEKLPQVRLFQADFETFELPDRFTLVYSVFDSLNNLLAPDAFSAMAARVARHLEPGGIFMFDINTTVGLRELCESGCVEGWVGDVYYRWDHSFDDASGFATVEAFCEKGGHSFVEVHFERPYDLAEVRELLLATDFSRVEALTYPTGECASEDAARIWVVSTKA